MTRPLAEQDHPRGPRGRRLLRSQSKAIRLADRNRCLGPPQRQGRHPAGCRSSRTASAATPRRRGQPRPLARSRARRALPLRTHARGRTYQPKDRPGADDSARQPPLPLTRVLPCRETDEYRVNRDEVSRTCDGAHGAGPRRHAGRTCEGHGWWAASGEDRAKLGGPHRCRWSGKLFRSSHRAPLGAHRSALRLRRQRVQDQLPPHHHPSPRRERRRGEPPPRGSRLRAQEGREDPLSGRRTRRARGRRRRDQGGGDGTAWDERRPQVLRRPRCHRVRIRGGRAPAR